MLEVIITVAALAAVAVITTAADWLLNDVILSPRARQMETKPVIDTSLLRPQDRDMIAQSQEIFREVLGDDMIASVTAKSPQERLDTVPELVERLAGAYGLSDIKLRIFQEASGNCGYYNRHNGELCVNIQYLMCDHPGAIREFYDTIVHELRHAVQVQMVRQEGFWGADQDLRAKLAHNFNHYIRADRDPKGYVEQLVERDAFTFAYETMEGLCKC